MAVYRRLIRLCQEWPLDKTKVGRDLGAHIRQRVADAFPQGEASVVESNSWESLHESLSRISTSHHKNKYPRLKENNCTGLTSDECQLVLSTETLQMLQDEERSFVDRMRTSLSQSQNDQTQHDKHTHTEGVTVAKNTLRTGDKK